MNYGNTYFFNKHLFILSIVSIGRMIRKTISDVINIEILKTLKPHNFFKT